MTVRQWSAIAIPTLAVLGLIALGVIAGQLSLSTGKTWTLGAIIMAGIIAPLVIASKATNFERLTNRWLLGLPISWLVIFCATAAALRLPFWAIVSSTAAYSTVLIAIVLLVNLDRRRLNNSPQIKPQDE